MSITYRNGIGFSQNTRAAYIDMAAVPGTVASEMERPFTNTPIDPTVDAATVWAKWGKNNLKPKEMYDDIGSCGILEGIIDGKARFAVCNGILPAVVHYDTKGQMVIDEILVEPEIDNFLEDNNHFFQTYGWMKDLCGFGNGVARFMLNHTRDKIAGFQRDDVTEMRYEKMDPNTGRINRLFLSAYWDKVGNNINDNRIIKVPLLHHNNPLRDLREKVAANPRQFEYAMTFKYPGWGRKYYSLPLWYAAYKWVKIAQGVPEMKAAIFENNFRPKYLVIISEQYWQSAFITRDGEEEKSWDDYTEQEKLDKKNLVFDEIDKYLAGSKNAYKSVFVDGILDPQTGKLSPLIDIRTIDDTTKAGELLPDSAAANSEIAFSMLFNPAIIGASMPSGPYTNSQGGSNIRESALLQVIIHELERQMIRSIFNVIKRFNGWDQAFLKDPKRKLEFIIPATIPTTLDTGSNVKQMVTGENPAPSQTAA